MSLLLLVVINFDNYGRSYEASSVLELEYYFISDARNDSHLRDQLTR